MTEHHCLYARLTIITNIREEYFETEFFVKFAGCLYRRFEGKMPLLEIKITIDRKYSPLTCDIDLPDSCLTDSESPLPAS